MKTKNHSGKKWMISALALGMALMLTGCYKPNSRSEVEEYVKNSVPEKVSLVGYEEQSSKSGTVYCYIFKSDSRDLEFRAFSSRGGGAIGGYTIDQYYDVGRDEYYLEKMRPYLTSCGYSEMTLKPNDTRVSRNMYLTDDAAARKIAGTLAKCNTIVAEQWNYQPGADLTKHDAVGISFYFYPYEGSKDVMGEYALNGMDDADTIYKTISLYL